MRPAIIRAVILIVSARNGWPVRYTRSFRDVVGFDDAASKHPFHTVRMMTMRRPPTLEEARKYQP